MLCFSHDHCNSSKKMHIVHNDRLLILHCVMMTYWCNISKQWFVGQNIFEIYAKYMLQTALIKKIYFFKLEIQLYCKMYFRSQFG